VLPIPCTQINACAIVIVAALIQEVINCMLDDRIVVSCCEPAKPEPDHRSVEGRVICDASTMGAESIFHKLAVLPLTISSILICLQVCFYKSRQLEQLETSRDRLFWNYRSMQFVEKLIPCWISDETTAARTH